MPIPVYKAANGGRCDHLEQVRTADGGVSGAPGIPAERLERHERQERLECRECRASGGRWLHLRECLVCGHVGCCDNSQSRHATAHWRATGHPLIRSLEPGEVWAWCYPDESMLLPSDC